jgi:hypothetical protein
LHDDNLLRIPIRAKEAMGRPRDREAIVQLRAIRERTGGG